MPGPQRDAERTQRRILEAAARAIATKGVGVSLDTIARSAGVSKGGLMHHFPSRDELLTALMGDLLAQFNEAVTAALDPADDAPGRLTRAYVRAVFADLENGERAREQITVMGMIGSAPGVTALVQDDDAEWRERILADGLDPLRAEIITKAADGATGSLLWSRQHPRELDALRDALLAMTQVTGPLEGADHLSTSRG